LPVRLLVPLSKSQVALFGTQHPVFGINFLIFFVSTLTQPSTHSLHGFLAYRMFLTYGFDFVVMTKLYSYLSAFDPRVPQHIGIILQKLQIE